MTIFQMDSIKDVRLNNNKFLGDIPSPFFPAGVTTTRLYLN